MNTRCSYAAADLWLRGRRTLQRAVAGGMALILTLPALLPAQAPEGKGPESNYAADLPRIPQVPAQEARGTFLIADGFDLELMAAEPLLASPVAIAWDEDGRLFVAEMRGYSEDQQERLGRIRCLVDVDEDGRFDQATVFAADLAWPTAVCCWEGGLFVADAPDILFLRDTDGDGQADERRTVFTGFGTGNVQGLLNSFAFGLDGRIHGSASSCGGLVHQVNADGLTSGDAVRLSGRDFSFDPRRGDLRPETGGGQHGRTFDAAGNAYVCSNSNHAIRCMIEDRFLSRNPVFVPPAATESIAVDGPQAEVFRVSPVEPWRILRTRLRASGIVPGVVEGGGRAAGYFTSATGITCVTGDACGSLRGMLVVGDVGSNLVHRKRLRSDGPGVRAERVDDHAELVASRDIWFRPVQFANAPDGGLWIIDMQREVIEHPASLAPPIKRHLDLASGRESGRLWRLAADRTIKRPMPRLSTVSTDGLVLLLDHANGWHRETAHRLLIERADQTAVPALRRLLRHSGGSGVGRQHAAFVLAGLGKVSQDDLLACCDDPEPVVRAAAVRLVEPLATQGPVAPQIIERLKQLTEAEADVSVRFRLGLVAGLLPSPARESILQRLLERDGDDRWCRQALFTSLPADAAFPLLRDNLRPLPKAAGDAWQAAVPGLLAQIARRGIPAECEATWNLISRQAETADDDADFLVAIDRLVEFDRILRSAGAAVSLHKQHPPSSVLSETCRHIAADVGRDPVLRSRAVAGLCLGDQMPAAAAGFLSASEPPAVVLAAIGCLARSQTAAAYDLLVKALPNLPLETRRAGIDAVLENPAAVRILLEALAADRIDAAWLDQRQIASIWRFPDAAVRSLAAEVLGVPPTADRDPIVVSFRGSLPARGDPTRGRQLFVRQCATCHRIGELGNPIGPNLMAAAARGQDAFLVGVLDPNREVLPAFMAHRAVTADGRVLTGLVTADSDSSVTLQTGDGVSHVLARVAIESLTSTERSLMPEGFERTVDPRGMADILAFLTLTPGPSSGRPRHGEDEP